MFETLDLEFNGRTMTPKCCDWAMQFRGIDNATKPSKEDPLGQFGHFYLKCSICSLGLIVRFS